MYRGPVILCLLLMSVAVSARAQQPATILLLRTAVDHGVYHSAEVIHIRGRLVPFDLGYIDFNNASDYREMWLGGGFTPIATSRASLTAEAFGTRAFGAHGQRALYFQPFLLGSVRVSQHVAGETEYFAYVPLNNAGYAQHVIERAKLEYDVRLAKFGAGYSGYGSRITPWQHKPFITATMKVPTVGNVEFWLQRLPGNQYGVQVRYAKVFVQ